MPGQTMPRPERLFYRGPHGKPQSVWNTLDAKPLRPALVPSGLVLYTDGQNLHTGERGRSEERRVGKEGRSGEWTAGRTEKGRARREAGGRIMGQLNAMR